jgi:hypothetical protein
MTQAWDFVDATILWRRLSPSNEFLSTPLESIELRSPLNVRFHTAIWYENKEREQHGHPPLQTVHDLVTYLSRTKLLRMSNLGVMSVDALSDVLGRHGVTLRKHG